MEKYFLIGLAAAVVILFITVLVIARQNKLLKFGGVKIKKGVRYSTDERIEKNNEANITYNQKDIILEINKDYVVGEGKMLPGTYTVLASNEENTKFNLRIGGVVREYTHGQKIVLSKGETITAVSHIVILR
jgi:hypothetical protein